MENSMKQAGIVFGAAAVLCVLALFLFLSRERKNADSLPPLAEVMENGSGYADETLSGYKRKQLLAAWGGIQKRYGGYLARGRLEAAEGGVQ